MTTQRGAAHPDRWRQDPLPGAPQYRGPALTAHGWAYWLIIGFWWEPVAWMGRMLLWLIPPIGLWRSARKGRRNAELRQRRGYRR